MGNAWAGNVPFPREKGKKGLQSCPMRRGLLFVCIILLSLTLAAWLRSHQFAEAVDRGFRAFSAAGTQLIARSLTSAHLRENPSGEPAEILAGREYIMAPGFVCNAA